MRLENELDLQGIFTSRTQVGVHVASRIDDHDWSPVVINSSVPWVGDFPGLWGLDTQDVFAGELAPEFLDG